jgi:hypothetical protein
VVSERLQEGVEDDTKHPTACIEKGGSLYRAYLVVLLHVGNQGSVRLGTVHKLHQINTVCTATP